MQELSVDDLDNVSGGCDYVDGVAYVYVNDPDWGTMSVDDYYDLVKWAYDSYGPDIAVSFALDIYPSAFIEQALRTGGLEYMRDTLKSRIIHFLLGTTSIHTAFGAPGADRCPEEIKWRITQKQGGFDGDVVIR